MGQSRLSNIAILNIEKNKCQTLDMNEIINQYANTKARKMNFTN